MNKYILMLWNMAVKPNSGYWRNTWNNCGIYSTYEQAFQAIFNYFPIVQRLRKNYSLDPQNKIDYPNFKDYVKWIISIDDNEFCYIEKVPYYE